MRGFFIFVMVWFAGCASTPIAPNDNRVQVGTQTPGPAYILISGLEASDGEGCGITKKWGTRDSAVRQLQAKGAEIGADYVRITEEVQPHREGSCRVNTYLIKGQAYRRKVNGK